MSRPSLPPGQQLAAPGKWPQVGERLPAAGADPWQLAVTGAVQRELCIGFDQLQAMQQTEQVEDIHCVTRWSKLGVRFGGVPLSAILDLARPLGEARFVSYVARSGRDHGTSLPLAEAISLRTLLALSVDSEPLSVEHGGPLRVVTPGRYFYKSLKWLARIELLSEDRLGFWEATAGYHNSADPWLQQRYLAPTLTRQEMARMLATRDWSGRDLRSIDARGHDLAGLVARGALLRDADFRGCWLDGARFDESNLSNAHFERASLRGASLAGADVEGANFSGADLRAADFRGASLLGVTFCGDRAEPALLDRSTQFDSSSLEHLAPEQQDFWRATWNAS